MFDAADLRKINKAIVGELQREPSVVKDEALLDKIVLLPSKEAQAFSIWQDAPFEKGSRQTAYFLLYYKGGALSNRNISNFLNENKALMALLFK